MDRAKGQRTAIRFNFDRQERGIIVQVIMHEIYVIVIYESSVCIFNAQTGNLLEEQGPLMDKFKYRNASLNYVTGNILLVAHN